MAQYGSSMSLPVYCAVCGRQTERLWEDGVQFQSQISLSVHTQASKYHLLPQIPLLGQSPAPDKPFNALFSFPSYLWTPADTLWYSITPVGCVRRTPELLSVVCCGWGGSLLPALC